MMLGSNRLHDGGLSTHSSHRAVAVTTSQRMQCRHSLRISCTVQPYRPTVEEKEPKVQAFTDWATEVGIELSKVRLSNFNGLRGLAATTDIQEDEVVLAVPRQVALTLPPLQKCPFPDLVDAGFWQASPWYVKMALKLAVEKLRGSESKLYPYILQLPKDVGVPSGWQPEIIHQLQYPWLINKVQEQKQELANWHRSLMSSKPNCPISKEDFLWALSCVRSRSFSGPYVASTLQDRVRLAVLVSLLVGVNGALGFADLQTSAGAAVAVFVFNILYEVILSSKLKQYAMCPMIDLLNHDPKCASEASYDYFRDCFSVATSQQYRPGQQVYVSYGQQQSNDSLMLYYGFFVPGQPSDHYIMTSLLNWLDQLQECEEERLLQLGEAGLLEGLQEVSIQRTSMPPRTLQALRFLLADSATAAAGVAAFREAGTPALEAKVGAALVHALQQELATMGSSIQEDRALLDIGRKKKLAAGPHRMAVEFRMEKKKVLAACLERLQGKKGY